MLTIMLYYDSDYKQVRWEILTDAQLTHLEKYNKLKCNRSVIKKQNMLFLKFPVGRSWREYHDQLNPICKTLTKFYNPDKNNLATYTPENYPELYI